MVRSMRRLGLHTLALSMQDSPAPPLSPFPCQPSVSIPTPQQDASPAHAHVVCVPPPPLLPPFSQEGNHPLAADGLGSLHVAARASAGWRARGAGVGRVCRWHKLAPSVLVHRSGVLVGNRHGATCEQLRRQQDRPAALLPLAGSLPGHHGQTGLGNRQVPLKTPAARSGRRRNALGAPRGVRFYCVAAGGAAGVHKAGARADVPSKVPNAVTSGSVPAPAYWSEPATRERDAYVCRYICMQVGGIQDASRTCMYKCASGRETERERARDSMRKKQEKKQRRPAPWAGLHASMVAAGSRWKSIAEQTVCGFFLRNKKK